MSIAQSARIHPTALLSSGVEVGENVEVGAYSIIEGDVKIGADCVIRPGVHIFGTVTLGRSNKIFTGAVLGEIPQHFKYNGEPTSLEIGDNNIFRENVTIHRGTAHSHVTRIGNDNFFMAGCHIAHDCVVGNNCILANGAQVAGHVVIENNAYLSGNCAVHQFIRIGRLSLLSGCSISTKDVLPFVIQQGINTVSGINIVGMRRAGLAHEQISAVKQAFRIIFRSGNTLPCAVQKLESEFADVDVIVELTAFLRKSTKGINMVHSRLEAAA